MRFLLVAACTALAAGTAFAQAIDYNRPEYSGLTTAQDILPGFKGDEINKPRLAMPSAKLSQDEPVTMVADEMGYDKDNAIVIARGNVEVVQGGNVLNAEKITYFQNANLVQAEGNVSLLQPSGDVFFADYVELQDEMKTGVIYQFRARLADNSVFAAREAHKVNQNVTKLKKAVYSPCKLCSDAAPFWQVKANKVKIDEAEERISYNSASMEMFGVPMFYTPYFSHPTPDAEARNGFLTPEYSTNGQLGTLVKIPYYWRINHSHDVELTPWFTSDQGPLLEADYRGLTENGQYTLRGSMTYPNKIDALGNEIAGHEFRGHVYARGEEAITDYSRVGFDIERASDDTYLRRYGFGSQRSLFSRAYYEAAKNRNYATAQGLAIQGLRLTDDPDTTPLVLPTLEGYYETEPTPSGLRFHTFANAQSLTRELGADQHRLSVTAGASLPYVTSGGHVITSTLNMRQDIYRVANVTTPNDPSFDGSLLRSVPQAAVEWRYPLIKQTEGGDAVTIEPIVLGVIQPNGGNPLEIPNEDNTLIELTDTNLFSINRMPGLDTVDSGPRLAYGARGQYLFAGGQSIDGLFGQNYNADDGTPYPNSTTPGKHVSDYIGRIGLTYNPVDFGYRFALDSDTLEPNRTELSAGFTRPWFSIQTAYRSLDNNRYIPDSEEGLINASLPLNDEWTLYGGARRDLDLNQMIATNTGLLYRNECFNLILQALRSFTRDRDVEPNTAITLRVGFKNLGEFGDN